MLLLLGGVLTGQCTPRQVARGAGARGAGVGGSLTVARLKSCHRAVPSVKFFCGLNVCCGRGRGDMGLGAEDGKVQCRLFDHIRRGGGIGWGGSAGWHSSRTTPRTGVGVLSGGAGPGGSGGVMDGSRASRGP